MSQGFWAVLLMTLLVQIFWFFGLHGTNVLGPVLDSIWLTAQIANMNAFMKGEALPFVWTRNAFDLYAWIGGAGSTLLLLIAILLFSKRDDQRTVAKLSIAPGCFNGFLIYVPFVKAANKLDPELTVDEPVMKKEKRVKETGKLEGDAV